MKVKEVIELLNKYPEDMDVCVTLGNEDEIFVAKLEELDECWIDDEEGMILEFNKDLTEKDLVDLREANDYLDDDTNIIKVLSFSLWKEGDPRDFRS